MRFDIKVAILKTGRPQWEIAQAIGVPEYTLSRFIRGHGKLSTEKIAELKSLLSLAQEDTDATLR